MNLKTIFIGPHLPLLPAVLQHRLFRRNCYVFLKFCSF